ncbi:MAG: transketolase [Endomicrobium sp.]|jgi:transketolase|nr:transketolase [Endomicrobium sp.]
MKGIFDLVKISNNIRKDIIKMLSIAGSGHPGSSLSSVELLVSLYFNYMNIYPNDIKNHNRDFFILSKGHGCPTLYSVLANLGYFPHEELYTLRHFGSRLQGHPAFDKKLPGIEISTGSLGYGLSIGAGIAIGIKYQNKNNKVYVLMGDGEQQEGSVWEAVMFAAQHKLNNLCAIIDNNKLQIDGMTDNIVKIEPIEKKYEVFGWKTLKINGHNFSEINDAYSEFKIEKHKPVVIIADTIKGKGISFMENKAEWHGRKISKEEAEIAIREINNA